MYLYDLGQGLARLGGNPAFGQSLEGVRAVPVVNLLKLPIKLC